MHGLLQRINGTQNGRRLIGKRKWTGADQMATRAMADECRTRGRVAASEPLRQAAPLFGTASRTVKGYNTELSHDFPLRAGVIRDHQCALLGPVSFLRSAPGSVEVAGQVCRPVTSGSV